MSSRNIVQISSACRRGNYILSPLNHMMNIILGVILWSLKKFSRKDRGKMFTARPRRTRTCRKRDKRRERGRLASRWNLRFLKKREELLRCTRWQTRFRTYGGSWRWRGRGKQTHTSLENKGRRRTLMTPTEGGTCEKKWGDLWPHMKATVRSVCCMRIWVTGERLWWV